MSCSKRIPHGVGTLAAALAVAACGDPTGPDELDEALLEDMAVVAADATLEDVSAWSLPFAFDGVATSAATDGYAPGRPGGRHGFGHALSGTREVTFYDADGNEQEGYDRLETASIHLLVDVEGEVSRQRWTASVSRTKDVWVTGLAGEETHRTFNGTGEEHVSGTLELLDGEVRSHVMDGTFTYTDVVVPVPGTEPGYPISGTIAREMTATITTPRGERTRSLVMTIAFDGDDTATITVNGETFEVDLTAGRDRHPLRPRG